MEREGKDETLPPGFRFHPTDEELITCYLINKISDASFTGRAITDVDLNKCEPWDLPGKAKMGEKEWYFFSLRDRKYPTGVRTNRATNTGYWKTTGKDKEIFNSVSSELVGMKKTLVFYRGRAPRGEKTNWVMHEYRIHSKSSFRTTKQDEWVVCRVFQKSAGGKKYPSHQSSRVVNPYNLEIGHRDHHHHHNAMSSNSPMIHQSVIDSSFHQHHHHAYQFPAMTRAGYLSNAELTELSRQYRGGGVGGSTTMNMTNMPMSMQSQVSNYPVGEGTSSFTISGLNLNLEGAGAIPSSSSNQFFRPAAAQPPPPLATSQQNASTINENDQQAATAAAYGVSINHGNGLNNRFMNIEHCADLDNYWPPY